MSVQMKGETYYVVFRNTSGKQEWRRFGRGEQARKETEAFDGHLKSDRLLGVRPEAKSKIYLET